MFQFDDLVSYHHQHWQYILFRQHLIWTIRESMSKSTRQRDCSIWGVWQLHLVTNFLATNMLKSLCCAFQGHLLLYFVQMRSSSVLATKMGLFWCGILIQMVRSIRGSTMNLRMVSMHQVLLAMIERSWFTDAINAMGVDGESNLWLSSTASNSACRYAHSWRPCQHFIIHCMWTQMVLGTFAMHCRAYARCRYC